MSRMFWFAALVALSACDDDKKSMHDSGEQGERCVPGQAVACPCTDGRMGAQTCEDDGTFAACVCAPTTGGDDADADTSSPAVDQGTPPVEADAAEALTPDAAVSTPDAALPEPDAALPEPDAAPVVPDLITGASAPVTSDWAGLPGSQGMIGLEAGNMFCAFSGGDHVCDYTELRAAEARGEFASVPVGTTAWVQRTTTELVNGVESPPGPGGNCNDWTFTGNHLADGEYVAFGAEGAEFFLDNDTLYDPANPNGPSVATGLLECGGMSRSIFCCRAP
jgi:hypothetical protein